MTDKQLFIQNYLADCDSLIKEGGVSDRIFSSMERKMFKLHISGQQAGSFQEAVIRRSFKLEPDPFKDGDSITPRMRYCTEIKTSRTFHQKGTFKLKKIRPGRERVQQFLIRLFDGYRHVPYWFWIPALTLYAAAKEYGQLKPTNGVIGLVEKDISCEINLNHRSTNTDGNPYKLWNSLLEFKTTPEKLVSIL